MDIDATSSYFYMAHLDKLIVCYTRKNSATLLSAMDLSAFYKRRAHSENKPTAKMTCALCDTSFSSSEALAHYDSKFTSAGYACSINRKFLFFKAF